VAYQGYTAPEDSAKLEENSKVGVVLVPGYFYSFQHFMYFLPFSLSAAIGKFPTQ
jgi:hypothetical protein